MTTGVPRFYHLLFFIAPKTLIVPFAYLIGYAIFETQLAGFGGGNRLTLKVAQFIGALFLQNGIDAAGKMGGAGTDGLSVVFAILDHLFVIDGGQLHIPLASDFGIDVQGCFDEVRASVGHRKPLGLALAALFAV